MNSKTIFNIVAALTLVVAIFVTPVAHASADASALPATATITEQNWSSLSVFMSVSEQTETTLPISLSNEIDQNQPSGPIYMAAFNQTDLAQSFMQTNANISGAGILLQAGIGTSDNVKIQLWDALPNAGGTMLAEASTIGTAGLWVDVFWPAVVITPSTTYYLVFVGNATLGIAGDNGNPYPNGHVFANPGFVPYTSFDFAFRTYYDTEVPFEHQTWANVKTLFD